MAGEELAVVFMLAVILFFVVVFALTIGSIVIWILMLVDCVKRKFKEENDKIVWILVIVLTGAIGAIIYYFVVKREDKH